MGLLTLLRRPSSGSAPAWTPAELPGIVDFGIWSDTTRLAQNSDGSGAVSAGSVVGWWQGQLGVITLKQAAAGSKPFYSASGIEFITGAGNKFLAGASLGIRDFRTTGTWALGQVTGGTARYDAIASGLTVNAGNIQIANTVQAYPAEESAGGYPQIVAGGRATADDATRVNGALRTITSFNNTGLVQKAWKNGVLRSLTWNAPVSGSAATYPIIFRVGAGTAAAFAKGWVFTSTAVSDDEVALLETWMQSL